MRTTASLTAPRLAARERRSPSRSDPRLCGSFLDERRETRQHVRIRLGEDAVAEVEDVPAPAGCAVEHVERLPLHALPRAEQDCWIEVALYASLLADDGPAGVER